jgi:hypothetical protein
MRNDFSDMFGENVGQGASLAMRVTVYATVGTDFVTGFVGCLVHYLPTFGE